MAMMEYLSTRTISDDNKIQKLIQEEKNNFKIERNSTIEKCWLYQKN